jgi:hypothetical protein
LTSADEEDLKEQLISEVTSQANSGGLTASMKAEFIEFLSSQVFEGLTPGEALARVIIIVRGIQSEAIPVDQLEEAAKAENVQLFIRVVEMELPMASLAADDVPKVESNLGENLSNTMTPLERVYQMEANVKGALKGIQNQPFMFQYSEETAMRNLQAVADNLRAEAAAQGGGSKSGTEQRSAQDIAIQAIVEKARSNIQRAFQRPSDVGCSMSILSWNEMRYAFGRLIANEYIGVQIVVRNLNDKQEFSLHDAELSVDTSIDGRFGRFYSGRDKLIVRGLSLEQADYTPRDFVVHALDAIGTVMSAALPVGGTVYKNATGVYTGGFLPGFKTVWTDHSVDQLNLLSDIGFSSSTNYKTVVPKSGSVMFVIFVPSKQFEEGWWTQSCVENIVLSPKSVPTTSAKTTSPVYLEQSRPQANKRLGIDLDTARELCRQYGTHATPPEENQSQSPSTADQASAQAKPPASTGQTSGQPQSSATTGQTAGKAPALSTSPGQQPGPTVLSVKPVHYKNWSPISLSIFRELAWAVVAGVHIQEAQIQSTITQLNCPVDELGNIQFNKTGTLSCDITGEGLDKVATLRLRNAKDATDTDTADGPVTVSGDPTKAKVTFQLSKLGSLNQPAYKVYAVTTTGVETYANQTLHYDLNPYVADLSPTTADPNKQTSIPFTLKGYHLDKIAKVQLFENAYASGKSPVVEYALDSGATAAQAAFTVKSADDDLKKKAGEGSGETLAVGLTVKNVAGNPVIAGTITLQSKSTVSVSLEALTFGAQNLHTTSAEKDVTLTNAGTGALTDFKVDISGTDSSSFEANACGDSVAKGDKCVINVKFTPASAGKLTATLDISYAVDGARQSQSVSLTGTGKSATGASLSMKAVTFKPRPIGTASSPSTVTMSNSGTSQLTDLKAKISGTGVTSFSESNTCKDSIAGGAKCQFTLEFTPKAKGKLTATLDIDYNVDGAKQSQSVSLAGTGESETSASLSTKAVTFKPQSVGTTSSASTVTMTNSGTSELTDLKAKISGASATSFSESSTCGSSLAGGAKCQFTLKFTAKAKGKLTAMLDIDYTVDGAQQSASVSLNGTGTQP